ncbi:YwqG family protein [Brevibacterium luteolum]|uniref:YwqG family protein n=1 Tax=Brevibacterium luteolum TaxID=199591 RepID=UPI00223B9CA0|nr:YwqG family protein [Brevibacterium luteolum]MCT1829491.1 YwqG family protein [Brevibacterium luteolum]
MKKLPRTSVTAASREQIVEWLNSPKVDAGFLASELKYSQLLLDQYEPGKDRLLAERDELGELSYLGGPALGPLADWPRNHDGEPLAHIATILLIESQNMLESDDDEERGVWPEPGPRLPATGYLEVFHHLGTYGNVEDDGTQGWLVRHVPFDGETFPPFVDAPADLDVPHEVCQPVLLLAGFSLPSPMEYVDAENQVFTTVEFVHEEMNAAFTAWRHGKEKVNKGPVFPVSRLYGHSDPGREYAHEVLREARPLTSDADSYMLLLSVESWTHFEGWFGDAGTLEVWIRASDLAAGRFEQAWNMIRTD